MCEGPHSNSVGFLLHNTMAYVISGTIKTIPVDQVNTQTRRWQTLLSSFPCKCLSDSSKAASHCNALVNK